MVFPFSMELLGRIVLGFYYEYKAKMDDGIVNGFLIAAPSLRL